MSISSKVKDHRCGSMSRHTTFRWAEGLMTTAGDQSL